MSIHSKARTLGWFGAGCAALATAAILLTPSLTQAVTVGPAKLELGVDPNKAVASTMFIENDTSQVETFTPSIQRFTENNGDKVFLPDSEIASWIQLPAPVTLRPGEQDNVPFTINAPVNAPPGGHFAVIWWSAAPATGTGSATVGIVTRAGILLYLTVSGDITEKGHIGSFSGPKFAWNLPIAFAFDFTDDGNVSLTPSGYLNITNLFGTQTASIPINPFGGSVLPQSNKSYDVTWNDNGFHFGVYHVSLDLTYGDNNTLLTQSYWLVVLSPWGLVALALILIVLFILPPLIRRYNRWIIKRAQRS